LHNQQDYQAIEGCKDYSQLEKLQQQLLQLLQLLLHLHLD
jgi:hypothetical protein